MAWTPESKYLTWEYVCICHCFSPLKEDGIEDENPHGEVTDTDKPMHSTFLTTLPGTCHG